VRGEGTFSGSETAARVMTAGTEACAADAGRDACATMLTCLRPSPLRLTIELSIPGVGREELP
jgi:hypothetical protein